MDTKQQALVVGAVRLGVGAALVAAPGWAAATSPPPPAATETDVDPPTC